MISVLVFFSVVSNFEHGISKASLLLVINNLIIEYFCCVKPGLHISRKDCKHRLQNMFFKLSSYGLVSMW